MTEKYLIAIYCLPRIINTDLVMKSSSLSTTGKGIGKAVVEISALKKEPEWMLDMRLGGLSRF